jgi:hypothetical protein
LSSIPIYGGLVVGFLVLSLLLQGLRRLTLKALLVASGVISLVAGITIGGGAFSYAALWETVLNVLLMSLVSFAILAAVSACWWRLACRTARAAQQVGPGEA